MIPMRQARNDDPIKISKYQIKGLRRIRRARWQLVSHIATFHVRQNRVALRVSQVVRHPVYKSVTPLFELVGRHSRFFMSSMEMSSSDGLCSTFTRRPTGPHLFGSVAPNNAA